MVRTSEQPPHVIATQEMFDNESSSDDEPRASVMKSKKGFHRGKSLEYEQRKSQFLSKMGFTPETLRQKLKRKYDDNNDGIFQEEEVDAMLDDFVDMMTKNQALEYTNDELMQKLRKMEYGIKWLIGLSIVLAGGCVVAVYFATSGAINKGNAEVKMTVGASVNTKVAADDAGHTVLQDRKGHDLSTRSFGDTFDSSEKVDRRTGEKLNCVAIEAVASMTNDVASGTGASLVIKNEEDGGEIILPINGVFKDDTNELRFEKFVVVMDDDRCNNPANGNLWSRRELLRRTSEPSETDRADVLARNRKVYDDARAAVRRGRSLQQGTDNYNRPSVPVKVVDGNGGASGVTPSVGGGTPSMGVGSEASREVLSDILNELGNLGFDL